YLRPGEAPIMSDVQQHWLRPLCCASGSKLAERPSIARIEPFGSARRLGPHAPRLARVCGHQEPSAASIRSGIDEPATVIDEDRVRIAASERAGHLGSNSERL